MITLDDFKDYVANRPQIKDEGYYTLTVLTEKPLNNLKTFMTLPHMFNPSKSHREAYKKYAQSTKSMDFSDCLVYPTFDAAFAAMMIRVGEPSIVWFKISNEPWGFAKLRNEYSRHNNGHDMKYWLFDKTGHCYDFSNSQYANEVNGNIDVHYLGVPSDQIAYKPGEVVKFFGGDEYMGRFTHITGIVLDTPRTIEEQWEKYRDSANFDEMLERASASSWLDSCYLIATDPYDEDLTKCFLVVPSKVVRDPHPLTERTFRGRSYKKYSDLYDEYVKAHEAKRKTCNISFRHCEIDPVNGANAILLKFLRAQFDRDSKA